ncbi:hypothetical protein CSUI_004487 [Cystoisospora suis]|uniref:Transmembrane protein n=1 Tax=Cystoisospora suis TaxID=483139 RepID=A0A2C6L0R1_9APIC|nr:hypothetical protein CSUI_004487 [Cystoisospora suis]
MGKEERNKGPLVILFIFLYSRLGSANKLFASCLLLGFLIQRRVHEKFIGRFVSRRFFAFCVVSRRGGQIHLEGKN